MEESKTILCIDGIPAFLDIFRAHFTRGGDEVLIASNGKAGFELLAARRVHAVVLDYEMPGMSGETVLQVVKRLPIGAPVVVLAGRKAYIPNDVHNTTTVVLTTGMLMAELLRSLERILEATVRRSLQPRSSITSGAPHNSRATIPSARGALPRSEEVLLDRCAGVGAAGAARVKANHT